MLNRTEISELIPGEMEAKTNSSTAAPRWEELKIVVCIQCFNVKTVTVSLAFSVCERSGAPNGIVSVDANATGSHITEH